LSRSIEAQITNPQPVLCRQDDWYNSPKVKELIRQSDRVWIASAWQPWDAALLPESLGNLRREFGDKFLIFGTKNFGSIDIKKLLSIPVPQRYQTRNKVSESSLSINRQLSQAVGPSQFVNLSNLMCGESGYCHVFRPDGRLLSYDGGHLTVEGGRQLALQLPSVPSIKNGLTP
jgi:hypothetical protein